MGMNIMLKRNIALIIALSLTFSPTFFLLCFTEVFQPALDILRPEIPMIYYRIEPESPKKTPYIYWPLTFIEYLVLSVFIGNSYRLNIHGFIIFVLTFSGRFSSALLIMRILKEVKNRLLLTLILVTLINIYFDYIAIFTPFLFGRLLLVLTIWVLVKGFKQDHETKSEVIMLTILVCSIALIHPYTSLLLLFISFIFFFYYGLSKSQSQSTSLFVFVASISSYVYNAYVMQTLHITLTEPFSEVLNLVLSYFSIHPKLYTSQFAVREDLPNRLAQIMKNLPSSYVTLIRNAYNVLMIAILVNLPILYTIIFRKKPKLVFLFFGGYIIYAISMIILISPQEFERVVCYLPIYTMFCTSLAEHSFNSRLRKNQSHKVRVQNNGSVSYNRFFIALLIIILFYGMKLTVQAERNAINTYILSHKDISLISFLTAHNKAIPIATFKADSIFSFFNMTCRFVNPLWLIQNDFRSNYDLLLCFTSDKFFSTLRKEDVIYSNPLQIILLG